MTHARQRGLERLESRIEVLEVADAHVADPEDPALQGPLSSGDNGPVLLPKLLPEGVVVDARRISDRGHGVGREAAIRGESEPERVDPSTRGIGEPSGSCEPGLEAF